MAIWLVRAGAHGEYEKKYLDENRIYLTWDGLNRDLSNVKNQEELRTILEEVYPDAPKGRITNNLGQIWAFSKGIEIGDWIVLPSKHKSAINVAEVKGDYVSVTDGEDPFFHYRDVEWIAQDIPRTNFDQDLLYSFGAFMTVCQVKRNDAEERIKEMAANNWLVKKSPSFALNTTESDEDIEDELNLEEIAHDQIAKIIGTRFKGAGLERLINAILQAKGYTTYLSPVGPDKGVDILAAPEPMGFGEPRICVQVKSGDSPLDRPTLDQLIGVMQNVQASHGLLVSWGGFKSSVDREEAIQFFRVRLWDQRDIIEQLFSCYDDLDEEIKTEIPLKRIWTVA